MKPTARFAATLAGLIATCALAAFAAPSVAVAAWPVKPVQVVIPVGAGGDTDLNARLLGKYLEKELGQDNPLKTAAGGYYDIDFALMYLRLRGAGMFFKVLNTPARIEVLEQMGHLDHNDARFLLDAATFYRAVDHGLRLISGHTEGSLPHSEWQLAMLTSLVARWVPPHLCDQPLTLELLQIRERTRGFFDRLFAADREPFRACRTGFG